MNVKELAGQKAAEYVRDGMVVGLGSGSTAEFTIRALGERVARGLKIETIATSLASARLAEQLGLEVVTFEDESVIDLTIDGADEVGPDLNLIKGRGGALLQEKIVASASTREIIVVDPSKIVEQLGTRAPLPVEVIRFAWSLAQHQLMELGVRAELRKTANLEEPFATDNGHFILDCYFPNGIDDAARTERQINHIPGVVENGLFVGLADLVIVGEESGTCRLLERP